MKRRLFSKIIGSIGLSPIPLLLNNCGVSTYSDPSLDLKDIDNRIVVLIQLKGGNDGLNTLIPMNQYDLYANMRPTIRIQENKLISLDSTNPSESSLGLNPSLSALKSIYEEGLVSIVQSVSYPNMDRSHFKSTDLWLTGGDGTLEYSSAKSGWIGRFLKERFPEKLKATDLFPDPLGIQLGNPNTSLGFHIDSHHSCSVNIAGQDPSGYYTAISGSGGLPPENYPDSHYGSALKYIMNLQESTNQYAKRISNIFDKGKNIKVYPDTLLANQLKTVARLISGGSKTKFFLVQLSDFDTHKDQVMEGDSLKGEHSQLLTELSEGVQSFFQDLEQLGISEQVLAMSFSEFGRKAVENGDFGTDHGKSAPLFLFGKNIIPGIIGTNEDLSEIDENGQLMTFQHDYRQLYSTILQDWLGASNDMLGAIDLGPFCIKKVPVVAENKIITK